jgi:phosphoribosylglycinamide formyltransferase-1
MSSATPRTRLPVVILISGRGSNMRVLIEHATQNKMPVEVRAVISNRADAEGLAVARDMRILTAALSQQNFPDRETFDAELASLIDSHEPQLLILAGYMRILSAAFIRRFANRALNIHPSLLPKYRGLHTHRRVLADHETLHGASVHYLTEELDEGPAVIQGEVPVIAGDTEFTLAERVMQIEHRIYPQAVSWIAEGRLKCRNGLAWLDGEPLRAPVIVR